MFSGNGNGGSGAFGHFAAGPPPPPPSSSFNSAPPNSATGAPAGPAAGTRGRGRGRGASRGTARGAGAFGVQRHTNLSWRKPDDTAPPAADETAEDTATRPEASTSAFGSGGSAFTAFGTAANGGFGTSSGANQDGTSSAFGAAPSAFTTTAFGSSAPAGPPNPFGAASMSSAFPSTSAQSPFGGGSAFASFPSAGSEAPPAAQSLPLFRAASRESEGGSGGDGPASLGEEKAAATVPKKRNPAQISTLEVLGEDSDARKKRFEATLPNNRYLEVRGPLGPKNGRMTADESFTPTRS